MAKVMISMPDDFLKQVDEVAKSRHQTRSEYFRELARRDLEQRREAAAGQASAAAADEAWARIQELAEQLRGVPFDSTAEIRRLRDAGWSGRQLEQVHDRPEED